MAKGVRIQAVGLGPLIKKFGRLPAHVFEAADREIQAAGADFEERAVNDAPNDQSILRQNIKTRKVALMHNQTTSGAKHSPYIEFGTKSRVQIPADLASYAAQFKGKGKNGSAEDAVKAIMGWVRRNNIRFDSAGTYKTGKKAGQNKQLTLEQTAWIIWHHINLVGVKAQPFFFKQRAPVMAALKKRLGPQVQKALKK